MFRFGLRSRVAIAFGILSMIVSMLVAGGIFMLSRSYLVSQRETASLTRALLDARSVDSAIAGGAKPGEALTALPVVGSSQALLRVGATWYTRGVTVAPGDLPSSLMDQTLASGGAQQRFALGGTEFYAVGVYTPSGLYFELFPLADLNDTLNVAALILLGLGVASFVVGGGVGRYFGDRLMEPLAQIRTGAKKLAAGDLSVRIADTGDPDLDPIADSFNDMAVAVASRIERERRFVANVSHELRSPLTTVVGTAELLESHADRFDPRDARLVTGMANQARRLSRILLDLLEISSVTASAPVQRDATDVAGLISSILRSRNLSEELLHGDRPIVVTDARRVERILANLIDNAGKHGGGVRQIVVNGDDGKAVVHVDDAGSGVESGREDWLFEPFVRGSQAEERRVEGAGLGLAIAREQAGAISAKLTAGPSPYGGARFTLEIKDAGEGEP